MQMAQDQENGNNMNNSNVVPSPQPEYVFELSLTFKRITPKKGGLREEVSTTVARLADGFSAKSAAKAASGMLYAVAIADKDENGKVTRKPIARSTCKTTFTFRYAVVKSTIETNGERVTSKPNKLFEFEKALNSSEASAGRWLHEVKGYLKAAFQNCELPKEAQTYFDAMNEAREKASERAKLIAAAKKAAKELKEAAEAKQTEVEQTEPELELEVA